MPHAIVPLSYAHVKECSKNSVHDRPQPLGLSVGDNGPFGCYGAWVLKE